VILPRADSFVPAGGLGGAISMVGNLSALLSLQKVLTGSLKKQ